MKKLNLITRYLFTIGLVMAFLAVVQVSAGSRQRPVSDWLSVQEPNFNTNNCAGTFTIWLPEDRSLQGYVDLTGKTGNCIQNLHNGPAINTQVEGTVKERDLADGTAEITVNVHLTNALAYARDYNQTGVPYIFGYSRAELFNHPERTPALATVNFQIKFVIAHPGDPLNDLNFTNYSYIRISANASGPLRAASGEPEGTPGKMVISQTGIIGSPGQGNGIEDGFPAELVRVFRTDD